MRITAIIIGLLLLPAALSAVPNMGIYFSPGQARMSYSPLPYEEFTGYVYENGMECYITASEFKVDAPPGIMITSFDIPMGSINLGDPAQGVSITYWPPLNGYSACNLLCTLHFVAMKWCAGFGGPNATLADAPMVIAPHPDTGRIAVTCWPENYIIDLVGMTSTICVYQISTHETSWGAIKSLFK